MTGKQVLLALMLALGVWVVIAWVIDQLWHSATGGWMG